MLGHFLQYELEKDVLEITAVRAADDGTDSHAWLATGKVTIDITSDQYKDSNEKVIVSYNSQ